MKSNLTRDERLVSSSGMRDMALGYPEVVSPTWLNDRWWNRTLGELFQEFRDLMPTSIPEHESLPPSATLEYCAIRAMCEFIGFPIRDVDNALVTLTGSTALWIAAAAPVSSGDHILVPEPVFDVIRALLDERGARTSILPIDWQSGALGSPRFMQDDKVTGVFLVTPDNPSGIEIDYSAFYALARDPRISETATFVVDQTFCTLVPSERRRAGGWIPALLPGQHWICVWDSGKSLDLDDEKLGFLMTDAGLFPRVRGTADILHCVLPRRTLILITLLMERAVKEGYLDWLWELRSMNAQIVKELGHIADVLVGDVGAFALVRSSVVDAHRLVAVARAEGWGLLTTSSFHGEPGAERQDWIRLPLLRNPDIFRLGVEALRGLILSEGQLGS